MVLNESDFDLVVLAINLSWHPPYCSSRQLHCLIHYNELYVKQYPFSIENNNRNAGFISEIDPQCEILEKMVVFQKVC